MSPYILLLVQLLLFSQLVNGQVNHDKARQIVLSRNKIGKEFSFVQSKNVLVSNNLLYDFDSLVLVYLGTIKTKDRRILKIVTSRWFWNTSPRATSRIIVFNSKNQYLGDYYLTMTYDVPDKIEGTFLIFINKKAYTQCVYNLVTKVNFKKGIPKHFFLKCTKTMGEIYSFGSS
jgi:hypothetical protein